MVTFGFNLSPQDTYLIFIFITEYHDVYQDSILVYHRKSSDYIGERIHQL